MQTGLFYIISLSGTLRLAALMHLHFSSMFGEPMNLYTDEIVYDDSYADITAEWYAQTAVETDLPEKRMESRPDQFEAEEIELELLEDLARLYLD